MTSASGRDEGTPEWSCHLQFWGGVGSCSNSRDGVVLGPSGLVVPCDQVADANLWRESVRRLAVVEDPPYAINPRQGVAFDVDQERAAVCGHGDRRDEARAAHLLRTGRRPQQASQRCWFAYIPTALQPSAFEDVGRCGQDQWCSRRQRRCFAPVQSCSAHGEPLVGGRIRLRPATATPMVTTSALRQYVNRLFAQSVAGFGLLGPRSRAGWIAFCTGPPRCGSSVTGSDRSASTPHQPTSTPAGSRSSAGVADHDSRGHTHRGWDTTWRPTRPVAPRTRGQDVVDPGCIQSEIGRRHHHWCPSFAVFATWVIRQRALYCHAEVWRSDGFPARRDRRRRAASAHSLR